MTHPEIWLTTTGVVGFVFLAIFAGIIPIRISAQAVKDEECDDSHGWGNALVGMLYFWATCILALFISAFILKNGLLAVLGFIALIVAVVGGIFVFASPCDSLKEAYIKAGAGTAIALFRLPLINYSWVAHFALFAYLSSPQEAFQEIVWGKEGVAVLNDVKYNVPNPTEAK